jgi:hypothetical protein
MLDPVVSLDEVKGISLLLYLLMVRMKLKLIKQCQEPLSLIDNFNSRHILREQKSTTFDAVGRGYEPMIEDSRIPDTLQL